MQIEIAGNVSEQLVAHESEGYIQVGPFWGMSPDDLERKMNLSGVFAHGDDCEVVYDELPDGRMFLRAVSDEVTGYFLDEEGIEASSCDVDMFLSDVLSEGQELVVEGCYPNGTSLIANKSRYMKAEGAILRDIERSCTAADGQVRMINVLRELSDYQAAQIAELHNGKVVSLAAFRRFKAA